MTARELPIEKIVLVLGETGVGKSTIVNMLYNRDASVDCCRYPQRIGSSSAAVTQHSTLQFDWARRWAILDTVGVGDPRLREEHILTNIRSLIKDTSKGVHAVVVVMKMGRASDASRANAHVLSYLFREADLRSHGVLVLTHWEGELGDEDGDLAAWYSGDEEMQEYCSGFSRVILTNNQLQGRGAYPYCRHRCLEQLCEHVEFHPDKIKARPVNLLEIVRSLVERFAEKLWTRTISVTSMVFGCADQDVPTYCGECSICHQQMELRAACKLVCNHSFHTACVQQQSTCPICREPALMEWRFTDVFMP